MSSGSAPVRQIRKVYLATEDSNGNYVIGNPNNTVSIPLNVQDTSDSSDDNLSSIGDVADDEFNVFFDGGQPGSAIYLAEGTDKNSLVFFYQEKTYLVSNNIYNQGDVVQVNTDPFPVCYASSTLIRTNCGEVAVEALRIGDVVVTASGQHRPIRWIGHREVDCAAYQAPEIVWPIRIKAGAVAMGVPSRDLLVSPDHCLVFDDVLVPAKHLINNATIVQKSVASVGYWHIELDSHEALLAEGLPAESYRDCGMHAFFDGAKGQGKRAAEAGTMPLLAPHVLSGPRLHAIKAWLIGRARHLGARRLDDPSLQLVADGHVLTPSAVDHRRFAYEVPEGTQSLVLRSRTSVPAHWIAENEDHRALGVRISDLRIDGASVAMNDARLSDGWSTVEPNDQDRWTAGNAHLPLCRSLSFKADWFLGYPVEDASPVVPVSAEATVPPSLRLVAAG